MTASCFTTSFGHRVGGEAPNSAFADQPPQAPSLVMAMTTCTCATYLAPADERFSFEPRSVQAIYIVSVAHVILLTLRHTTSLSTRIAEVIIPSSATRLTNAGLNDVTLPANFAMVSPHRLETIESALLVVRRNSDASRSMTSVVPHPGACWCKKRFTSRRSLSAYGTGSGSGALSRHLTMSTPLRNTSLSDPNFVERASKGVTA